MKTPFKIPCVILSGGKSSRMGEDKSLLPFLDSNSLIEYQFNRLSPYFSQIYISSKTDKFPFIKNKSLILDENKDIYSPILALSTIFSKLHNKKVFILPVDTPFVSIQSIQRMIEESYDFDIVIAQTSKTHNLCGVFSSTIKQKISSMIKDDIHKINYLIKSSNHKFIEFDNDDEFTNINDKLEYEKAVSFIKKTNITYKTIAYGSK